MKQQAGIPKIVGDKEIIAFFGQKDIGKYFNGFMDNATLHQFYEEDPVNGYRGLMKYWNQQRTVKAKPMFEQLIDNKAVIEVNGQEGTFSYDVPVEQDVRCHTEVDMSHQQYPGIDESIFYIVLNREFAPGTVLTYDAMNGQQIVVAEEEEVQPTGSGFNHPVKLMTEDREEWFSPEYLSKGIEYFDIGHGVGEFGTKFAKLQMPEVVGHMRCIYQLGSVRGVEAAITGKADSKNLGGATAKSKEYINRIRSEMDQNGWGDFAVRMSLDSSGKPIRSTANIGSTVQFLVGKYLHQLTGSSILFQKAATIKSANGNVKYNEGIWHQLMRGYRIKYGRAIQVEHLKQANEYIFRINPDLPYEERETEYTCGTDAYYSMLKLFEAEILAQQNSLAGFLGADRQIPNPVEGKDLLNLSWNPVRFTRVFIPQLGYIKIVRDTSMDRGILQDRFSAGMAGSGRAHTSSSMMVADASSQKYSNNRKNMPTGTTLVEGGDDKSNIFIVKPEGPMTYSGGIQGRYSSTSSRDIVASHKQMTEEYWAYNNCAGYVEDPSKIVIIEKQFSTRRGFN